jgi:hypothetical protein
MVLVLSTDAESKPYPLPYNGSGLCGSGGMPMEEKRLTEEEFVIRAIKTLRKPPYRGIHSVYSGFNEAFRQYFGKDPVEVTTRLAQEGKIETRPVRGGVMLYLPGEAPARRRAEDVLGQILRGEEETAQEGTG